MHQYTYISSTITELIPALCFNNKFLPKDYTEIEPFFEELDLNEKKSRKTFVSDYSVSVGKNLVLNKNKLSPEIRDSKFQNCYGILEYLYTINDAKPIKNCVWGAYDKPLNIDKNHPGDIFITFNNGDVSGISIKAGTKHTIEPRLNSRLKSTLLKPVWMQVIPNSLYEMKQELWTKIYSNVPELSNTVNADNYIQFDSRNIIRPNKSLIDSLVTFQEKNPVHFDEMYWELLRICNSRMIGYINNHQKTSLNWIKSEFRINQSNSSQIPIVLLKAINNKYTICNDNLAKCITDTKNVNAYLNPESKQSWYIDLEAIDYKQSLNMVIRSDSDFRREKPKGKLGAFMNLKLQYKGCK